MSSESYLVPRIKIVRSGVQTSVQDTGRRGFEHLGITVGGWVDDFAARWANRLLGNAAGAAVLEFTLLGPEIVALDAGWASLTGADMGAKINDQVWHPGSTAYLHAGDRLTFGYAVSGIRTYLGLAGGIEVPVVFSSRATDLVGRFGGFGGRALQPGDEVVFKGGPANLVQAPVDTCRRQRPIRVLQGVRVERFPPGSWDRLLQSSYRVTDRSDRIGLRLEGPSIGNSPIRGDSLSEGIAIGSIEAPPSGELLVLLKSRGSVGGYPTVAHVAAVDWPALGQLSPGDDVVFEETDPDTAEAMLRERETLFNLDPLAPGAIDPGTRTPTPNGCFQVRASTWCILHGARFAGQAALVRVGDQVSRGQPLAIVEVMSEFFELKSPCDGRILSMHFTDGNVVEKGKILFVIAS